MQYHKIQSIFKRDRKTKKMILGDYTLPEFEYLKNNLWDFTEKYHGINVRVMYDGLSVTFGDKTDCAQMPPQLMDRLTEQFSSKLDLFWAIFNGPACFYGEGIGPKIQKGGGRYREYQDFVLFDVKVGRRWLERKDVEKLGSRFGVDVVPVFKQGTLATAIIMASNGFNSTCGNFLAEGIVARPQIELNARNGERIITKIKHKDFKEMT